MVASQLLFPAELSYGSNAVNLFTLRLKQYTCSLTKWRNINSNISGSTATRPSRTFAQQNCLLVKDFDKMPALAELPNWGFDGSSTRQAEGHSSDCVLKPVSVYPDPTRKNGVLVLSEVCLDRRHASSLERPCDDPRRSRLPGSASSRDISCSRTAIPLGFPKNGYPYPQGKYYTCGVGYENVGDLARKSWMPTWTSALIAASITKASTRKSRKASGNSRKSSARKLKDGR